MNRSRFFALGLFQLGLIFSLYAQELTLSPYSRYGIGDIFSNTTTRNAGMGGIGMATDNYFSLNRINPAGYADLVFTTFDISGFSQLSNLRSNNSTEGQVTAGFQDIGFGFPSNKNLALVIGFAPYSAVGYNASQFNQITLQDTVTYLEETRYNAQGGLNQLYFGAAFRLWRNKLRLGVNFKYLFGNTRFDWTNQVLTLADTIGVPTFQPLSIRKDVYIKGLSGQVGIIYQDTINADKRILYRIGASAEYSLNLTGDRFTIFGNGSFSDTTLSGVEYSEIIIPPNVGGGFMVNRPGYWSVGADFSYQDWGQFQYFTDQSVLGRQVRAGFGVEVSDPESFNYLRRINYRFGAYWRQSYIQINDQSIRDIGVTVGFGLPAGLKGNSRLNQGRASSRVNLSAELGRRGSLNNDLPLEEFYARFRLGITLNDRWFIRRVVD
jgi:hypothetical protein